MWFNRPPYNFNIFISSEYCWYSFFTFYSGFRFEVDETTQENFAKLFPLKTVSTYKIVFPSFYINIPGKSLIGIVKTF
jgi:hypothetical protein